MNTQTTSPTIEGHWLTIARTAWLLITGTGVAMFAIGVPLLFQQLVTTCTGPDCLRQQLAPEALPAMAEIGLPLTAYAAIQIGLAVMVAVVYVGVGLLVFWRRSHELMALASSLWLVTFGLTLFEGEIRALGDVYQWAQPVAAFLVWLGGVFLLFLFFCIFPNGRFVPGWIKWLWLGMVLLFQSIAIADAVLPPVQGMYEVIGPPLWGLMIVTGIGLQIYRYRHVSNANERQQTKWVIFALLCTFLGISSLFALEALGLSDQSSQNNASQQIIETAIPAFAFLTIPLGIGISILRYRLYDIDIIIQRTVQYGIVTAFLAAIYFASIMLIQRSVTAVTGTQSPLAIVLSTLLIAALFNPLRRRVQTAVDRRFYRQKYDAQQILAHFAQTARDEVEMDVLQAELVQAVQETMQPEQISVWIKPVAWLS